MDSVRIVDVSADNVDATRMIREQAENHHIAPIKVIELKSAHAIRKRSPTPYGVFAAVLEGSLLSYRYLTAQEFKKAIDKAERGAGVR